MRASRPYRFRRRPAAVAAALGLALTAGLLTAPPATAATPDSENQQNTAQSDTQAAAQETASAQAVRTGEPVPVDELTTETETVTALPDGSFASTRYAGPVRTRQNGTWVDLDPTLVQAADGTWRPKATTKNLTLSGGGTAPMAAMTARSGQELAVSWPTALPQPVVDGAGATYAEVLPGVDLKVTATVAGGFTQVLVVKTAEAAQNPQLASLQLGLAADGVTVSKSADGSLAANSPDGTEVFTAPKAVMWDSTATAPAAPQQQTVAEGTTDAPPADEIASNADGPGAYARVADVDVTPTGSHLSVEPEPGFLTAPDTVFPVYIDPDWTPVWRGNEHWTWVQEGCPNVSNFDDYGDEYDMGVGLQRWTTCLGRERTYTQVDSFDPAGKIVNFATFNAIQSYAADWGCTDTHGVDLYWTGMISGATTWNNQPATLRSLGRQFSDSAGSPACPNGTNQIAWNITQLVRDEGWRDNLTFGMYGAEENQSGSEGFKRYTRKSTPFPHSLPFLYIEYNTPPNKPYNQYIWPEPKNPENGLCGWLGKTNDVTGVRMYANVSDPDPGQLLDAQFHLWDVGVNPPVRPQDTGFVPNPRVANGSQISAQTLPLLDGHRYNFAVQAGDGLVASSHFAGDAGWAWGCPFGVDLQEPSAPVVNSTDWPESGSGTVGKYAGEKGTFTFTAFDPNNGSGLDMIEYAFNSPLPTVGARAVRDADDGSSDDTVTLKDIRIDTWGTNYLNVRAVDRAGNRSQPTLYVFYAPYDPNRPIKLGDITKDAYPDLVQPDDDGNLRIYPRNAEPGTAGTVASYKANGANDPAAMNDDTLRTWDGVLTSHRGGTGVDADDLWVYRPGTPANPGTVLSLYLNTAAAGGTGPAANNGQYFVGDPTNRINVIRPLATQCRLPGGQPGGCGTAYATDWSRAQQILAVGDVDAASTDRAAYDLITTEGDGTGTESNLWLYKGVGRGAVGDPYLLDTARNWAGYTLATPGDVTGDGVPDLWARNTTTGDLIQYPLLRNGTEFSLGAGTTIRTGLTGTAYPTVSSDGDLYGDTTPDLWAVKPNDEILIWPGRTTTNGSITFDPPVSPIAGEQRLEAEDLPKTGFSNANCCGTTWSGTGFAYLPSGTGTLTVTIPNEGDYAVNTVFTTAPDYGIVEVSVDGQRVGAPFDAYSTAVATRPIPHGSVHLAAGTHTLTYTVNGQNPASGGGHAGVDLVQLTPTTGGANPVADPGFELQPNGTLQYPYWSQGRSGVDINQWVNLTTPYAKTGTSNGWVNPDQPGWAKLAQPVFVKPNTTYKLTAQIQTGTGNQTYFGAQQWNNGPILAETHLPTTPTGYQRYELTINTGTLDRIDIYAGTWKDGTDPWLRIDDIKLQIVT